MFTRQLGTLWRCYYRILPHRHGHSTCLENLIPYTSREASRYKDLYRSISIKTSNPSTLDNRDPFTPIYRCRYIVHLKVLARLKIYQTGMTIALLPIYVNLYNSGSVSLAVLEGTIGLASLACGMLYLASLCFMKVVGIISISDDLQRVKLSHLSFWGKRRDIVCDVSDIIPMQDISEHTGRVYLRLKRYSTNKELWFFKRYGYTTDQRKLEHILGPLK